MLLAIPVTTGDLLPTEGYLSAVLVYIEGLIHFLLLIPAMESDEGNISNDFYKCLMHQLSKMSKNWQHGN